MMRTLLVICVVLAMCYPTMDVFSDESKNGTGDEITKYVWSDDIRVTYNSSEDAYPDIAIDNMGRMHITWYRDEQVQYYTRFYREKQVFPTKEIIAGAGVPRQHCSQPMNRLGVDDGGNVHMIYNTKSYYGTMYIRYDYNMTPLTAPINLAPTAYGPHAAALRVGHKGSAYAAFENEGTERIEIAIIEKNFNIISGLMAGSSGEGVSHTIDFDDNVHVFNRGWAQYELIHTKFSPTGATLISGNVLSDNPVHGNGWEMPMPEAECDSDGNVHILLQSGRYGSPPAKLYYFALDKNGTRLTSNILVWDSVSDYGDIAIDGEGNVHLVWTDYDTGRVMYSVIKRGSSELSKPVEIVNSMQANDVHIGICTKENIIYIAWVDSRDGNPEIYYKYASPAAEMMYLEKSEIFLHPGEKNNIKISIYNIFDRDISANLAVNITNDAWNASIDVENVDLKSGERKDIELTITAPIYGENGSKCLIYVYINAPWMEEPLIKNITAHLIVERKINIHLPNYIISPPGEKCNFSIRLENIGDMEENVLLLAEVIPLWRIYFEHENISIQPGETKSINATLDGGVMEGTTCARFLAKSGEKTLGEKTIMIASIFADIPIFDEGKDVYLYSGEWKIVELNLRNAGFKSQNYSIDYVVESVRGRWNVNLLEKNLSLGANESKRVRVKVSSDIAALMGDFVKIKISAHGNNYSAETFILCSVMEQRNLSVDIEKEIHRISPGGMEYYRLTVKNMGNVIENISLGMSKVPIGWFLRYMHGGVLLRENEIVRIYPGETDIFLIGVYSSIKSSSGIHEVIGRILTDEKIYTFSFDVEIMQTGDIDVSVAQTSIRASPGSSIKILVSVKNYGNMVDDVRMEVYGIPEGWMWNIDERISVEPGKYRNIVLEIDIPSTVDSFRIEGSVKGTSSTGITDEAKFVILVPMSNLRIDDVKFIPSDPRAREDVVTEITVTNDGMGTSSETSIYLFVDNELIGKKSIKELKSGEKTKVSFVWNTEAGGTKTIKIYIDPLDTVDEDNERDNSMTVYITPTEEILPGVPGFECWILIIASAFILFWRRKN